MNKTKLAHMITVVLAVVAMALPYGAVCRFITVENDLQRESIETYSYFDTFPFGCGNLWPLFTAISTCVLLLLLGYTYFGTETKGLQTALLVFSCAAFVFSLLPLVLYGLKFFNTTALCISYLLGCSIVMSVQRLTGKYFVSPFEEAE